ncbi:MAG: PKD domain-containing protein [Candidatus Thermoplasmatota archaeon]|nr:PKD domain-containing protein [Candidatus Thermoplasmatota archaeon]
MNAKFFTIALAITMLAPAAGCLESVFNRAPIVDFSINGFMESGSPLTFDGTKSTDYDGNITTWSWDFGDGAKSNASKPTHSYADNGIFTVNLTVTDNLGKTATRSTTIAINGTMTIKDGDYVEIKYTGRYASNGTVFDTSIYSVALEANQTTGLRMRGNASAYSPLKVIVANVTQPSGEYTPVIAGLREGLIGMAIGDSKTITIPPEKGYGNWTINEYSYMNRSSESNITETYGSESGVYSFITSNASYKEGSTLDMIVVGKPARTVMTGTIISLTTESVTIRSNVIDGTQFTDDFNFNRTIVKINENRFRIYTTAVIGNKFVYQSYYYSIAYKVLAQNETTITLGMSYAASAKDLIGETLVFNVEVAAINRN